MDTTTPLNTIPAVMSGDLKINPAFLQLLRQASVIVIRKNTQHRVPLTLGSFRGLWKGRGKKINFLVLRDFYRRILVANILMSLQD